MTRQGEEIVEVETSIGDNSGEIQANDELEPSINKKNSRERQEDEPWINENSREREQIEGFKPSIIENSREREEFKAVQPCINKKSRAIPDTEEIKPSINVNSREMEIKKVEPLSIQIRERDKTQEVGPSTTKVQTVEPAITDEIVPVNDANEVKQQAKIVEQKNDLRYRQFKAVTNGKNNTCIFKMQGEDNIITTASVGPYHSSAAAPHITNHKKGQIVEYLVERQGLDKQQFLDWALQNEDDIRSCYENDLFRIKLESDEFGNMLLDDGCLVLFAIFHLRSSRHIDKRPSRLAKDDSSKTQYLSVTADIALYMRELKIDLLKLDNQIPFSVVDKLYKLLQNTLFKDIDGDIREMALSCFDDIMPGRSGTKVSNALPKQVHHLLHLFHWSRIPSSKYQVQTSSFVDNELEAELPSASELRESATLCWKSPPGSSLEVSFHRSIFRIGAVNISIPAVHICGYSETIFRNLMSFEQSYMRASFSVTVYSICMARLLQNIDDAKILRGKRILAHSPKTDQEIVDLFRKLSEDYKNKCLPEDFIKLKKDVATHHNKCLYQKCGGMMIQFCPNGWIVISVLAAIILFSVTVTSGILSMIRFHHHLT
ncbi:hypothetical protein PR202_ga11666 [Eleusine coracana subsp. coracana]|uniref:Uncharacterized protein n=1 Tax=Eleusine coracana subsp. coracana TaxID=191504 RepID=A0AAV5CA66_ELECO|nr:hypothetical protein PR202_ga11666 [Eleusine coracana subsp. coracana]